MTTKIFKALSEEIRLRILALLFNDEACVCEIEAVLNLSQSNASRHLSCLKNSGILKSYKKAQWTYYKINGEFSENNLELMHYLQRKVKETPTYQQDLNMMKNCKCESMCK
ncbi:ArsR/SmtB family transcription factor [Oscillospiraceae bacterium LTW-04]|nr:metalloregulator ArsR/SmtB family transcription factor [Oscillospiraceae bacterium MB24-C1]